ncbi:amidohydrolase family protein [Aquabacter spiritensis]|uniref:Putative TIM-barrel fold metal-dependent hydrolase n=1 Tax=Aquabacter spiritensis TaxID=933073 RepID=A0A4R3LVJ6_9HYPH|nr:amidohydrolase family protein [Aquabacter spiritensis]TCT04583.1 putative TIM-barrel fold metal-dependent hydrolase [Aquabacter spiritensis]
MERTEPTSLPPAADRAVPPRACDCHVHVFDPARFPLAAGRAYTPGAARLDALEALMADLGIARAVLVQPSVYGADNSCLLAALAGLGPRGRGVIVVDPAQVTDADLRAFHQAGARGVRINLESRGETRAAAARAAFAAAAERVAGHGFVLQIYADLALLPALADDIARAGAPVVLDHFAGARAERGLDQPGFAELRDLLATGQVWVKLSAPYRASQQPDHADLAPIARALIAARPDRLVWASDWPHTGGGASRAQRGADAVEPFRAIDDKGNLAMLAHWCGAGPVFDRILADNAARLFDFPL